MHYIRTTKRDTNELKNYLEERYNNSRRLRLSLRQIGELKTNVGAYEAHLLRAGNELELITLLEKTASEHNVSQKIDSSNLDTASQDALTLSIGVSGTYAQILQYLQALERLPWFLNPEFIQLTPGEASPNSTEEAPASLRLMLSVYVVH